MRGMSVRGAGPPSDVAPWACTEADLLSGLATSPAGLTEAEAARRRRTAPAPLGVRRTPGWRLALRQVANPIILILLGAAALSAALGELTESAIVVVIVGASGALGWVQERGAVRAIHALLDAVSVHADVLRDGAEREVRVHDVVAGDVVVLRAGDVIPGDCRVIAANRLQLDEAPLTGEAYPRHKSPGVLPATTPLARRSNMLHLGTYVASGEGRAVVVRTGVVTEYGRIAGAVAEQHLPTAFERGITAFGYMLMRAMAVLVVAIFAINVALHRPVAESLLFSLALAVGLTPQMLPAIVTLSLSRGAIAMARRRVIVKRLDAIEDVGGLDVLCTDKTGTITIGAVALRAGVDVTGAPDPRVLEWAWVTARHQRGFANPLDAAILAGAATPDWPVARDVGSVPSHHDWSYVGEVPFDFVRKRMSVLVESRGDRRLVVKGALEPLLARCTSAMLGGARVPIDDVRARLMETYTRLSADGYRVLGVAHREWDDDHPALGPDDRNPPGPDGHHPLGPDDERDLVLAGLLTFADPPKPGTREAIRTLARLGVRVRIITGDNRLAAAHVAAAVGLDPAAGATGPELAAIPDADLPAYVERLHWCAETDPIQKVRVVRAYSRAGHTVGYLGDGINDSPALHAADVGVSVDGAVDVAKQTADLVLLTKDLAVLAAGIEQGRRIFTNTLKYVHVTTSANFGNMLSLAAATALLPWLPMLPLQILLLNFLSDIPGMTIATDDVDREQVSRPRTWDIGEVRRYMVAFGLTSTVFDLATFAVLRVGYGAGAELLRSGWFVESTLTELAALLVLRTTRRVWRSRPGAALAWSSLLVGVVTVALPYSPIAGGLGLVGLPWRVCAALAAITVGYVVATEVVKAVLAVAPVPPPAGPTGAPSPASSGPTPAPAPAPTTATSGPTSGT